MKKIKTLLSILAVLTGISFAQTCGFGCLGLSGAYGGYTMQSYKAEGLNNYLIDKLGEKGNDLEFSSGTGFRIGGNIVRAQFDDYFFTVKGFYQFLNEENKLINDTFNDFRNTYTFKVNYWGLGVDVGVPICGFLDLKILDAGITFIQADFEEKEFSGNIETSYTKYENEDSELGYYFGSGVIIYLVPDYISFEGTAYYSVLKIKNMINDSGKKLLQENSSDLLSEGGFSFTMQLNISFPI